MILKEFAAYTREFRRHWLEYLMLFLSLDLLNQFVIIPLFRYITTFVLQAGAIPFVSYQNIITIITTHTIVFIILIIELLLLLVMIYAQFAYLLHGVRAIYSKNFTLKNSFKQIWQNIKKIRLGSLLLLALYFLLVIPFADIVFRTPLLAKIQIPEFILDYMTRTPILLINCRRKH
ncbi:glycerophosphoryl diester phosphodiesterase membrane domain-containing protein, partial [Lactobacillus helveticus]|uniref:glycerophosphoryl diester phosphodiesterase membrane domain-containing protein n=2 Tax=Lactobacillus TaxID=1578 RepID=UPI0015679564